MIFEFERLELIMIIRYIGTAFELQQNSKGCTRKYNYTEYIVTILQIPDYAVYRAEIFLEYL